MAECGRVISSSKMADPLKMADLNDFLCITDLFGIVDINMWQKKQYSTYERSTEAINKAI